MKQTKMRRVHLMPLVSFLPLLIALILVTYLHLYLSHLLIFIVAVSYVVINVTYRMLRRTLNIAYIVEYALVSVLVYFILTLYA